MSYPSALLVAGVLIANSAQTGNAQISKGQQILINRGLQLQGLAQDDCYLTLGRFTNLNYTSINWINSAGAHSSRPDWMGPAPGFPWARWASDETQMPPQSTPYGGDESPFISQLLALQLGDEWNLNDDTTRTRLVNWFNSVRSNWPNVMLYHNSYGSQVGDAQLADFYTRAHPDMLCFDTYPWQSVWDSNLPNHTGAPLPGPPTGWYGDLRRYREHAKGAGIPLGLYRQTFHSVQDYDQHVFRDPSPSELRLNTFAGLAFNAKYFTDFVYNLGANSLFTNAFNGAGDSVIGTNGLYAEMADINLRAVNYGKALVSLTAITNEAVAGYTTSVLFIRGKDPSGTPTTIPVGFLADPEDPNLYTRWAYQFNDPWLTNNWTVINKGTKNNGQPGDVIISWFKPLDEAFDGTNYSNETYLMVVNGFTDPSGTAADCAQEITLNFSPSLTALDVLNPLTGVVQTQALTLTNGLRQLVLNLNGGDATLFKFSDGAPFVGYGGPAITTQPADVTAVAGTSATFSTRAGGGPLMAYQWKANGTNVPGATLYSYSKPGVQTTDNGSTCSVLVSNLYGSVTSSIASLNVLFAPQITNQPVSQLVTSGSNVLFTAAATGNPAPTYQWRINGTNLFGATGGSYTRTNAQSGDSASYSVVASNLIGMDTSSVAVLTVVGPPSIIAQPKDQAVLAGGSAAFSVTAVGAGVMGYQWQRDGIAVPGGTGATRTINNVQLAALGNYAVTVKSGYGSTLSAAASLTFASAPTIQVQPQNQSVNAGAAAFFSVSASGGWLGYQWQRCGTNLADGGNIFGAHTSILALTGVTRLDATNYTVVITNVAGSVTSSPALLTVGFAYPLTEPFNYPVGSVLSNQVSPDFLAWTDVGTSTPGPVVTNGPGNLAIPGVVPPTGNSVRFGGVGKSARLSLTGHTATSGTIYFSFALSVLDLSGSTATGGFIAGFNNSTGTQTGQPSVIAPRVYVRTNSAGFNLGVAKNSDTDTVWDGSNYATNQTVFIVASYSFTTVGNSTDDIVRMWINPDPATFGLPNPPPAMLTATSGSDITANQIASFVLFQRTGTAEPAAMVADELRIDTTWAGVTTVPAPVILLQPVSLAVNAGTTNGFTVGAVGANLSYQWVRNGVPLSNGGNISGATTSALKLSPASGGDGGYYQAIVSNGGVPGVSATARLSINAVPSITVQPQNQAANVGSSVSFGVAVSGTAPFSYQWRFNGANLPGATGSSYNLAGVQRTNGGSYSAAITNVAGSITSSNGLLTVNPVTPVQINGVTLLSGGRIQLSGSGDPGQFIVQASSNLFNWADQTNILGGDGTFQYVDSITNARQQFYRVKLYP